MALGWRREYLRYRSFFLNIVNVYKQKRDVRMFLEILLSLATVSIFGLFALKPTVLTVTELIKSNRAKQETLNKLDAKIDNLQAAQVAYEGEGARINLVDTSVPKDPTPESFVRQIEGLSSKNAVGLLGVSLAGVRLAGPEDKVKRTSSELEPLPEGAKGLAFNLSVAGDFAGLSSFLTDLENLRRPIKIDSSSITSAETEEGARMLVLAVAGRTPYLEENLEK